jgi:3-deoxy-D-manno-octulosonic-acid transferase
MINLFLYTIGLNSFGLLVKCASPFNKKAKKWVQGRKDLLFQLKNKFKDNSAPVAWFHCASLGEFEQARPLLEQFKTENPNYKILLTFFSPSGYEIRKDYQQADYVFYLPLDTKKNARQFIETTRPTIAFFAKYEFWYYYIRALKNNSIPVISFSTTFRPDQIFFKPYGTFYRNILKMFEMIFVQNENSYRLLKSIRIENVAIAGDTRFDRVKTLCDNRKKIELVEKFKGNKKLLVIGSSWPQDIQLLAPFIQNAREGLKVIIAPHEIHENELEALQKELKGKSILYSKAELENLNDYTILIIDNVGMLSSIYQYAEFAYIGGAFGKGLHNILEAATYGMPIFFGPKYSKFNEATDLVKASCAFPVNDIEEFTRIFDSCYSNENLRVSLADKCSAYVSGHTGATRKILAHCKTILPK